MLICDLLERICLMGNMPIQVKNNGLVIDATFLGFGNKGIAKPGCKELFIYPS